METTMAAEIPATSEVVLKSDAGKQFLDTLLGRSILWVLSHSLYRHNKFIVYEPLLPQSFF
jgi:hypothetical protein